MVRPWRYQGKSYLAIANPERARQDTLPTDADRAPLATPFVLLVKGRLAVTDVTLGVPVPVAYDGAYTVIHGLVDNPGGVVYRLTPATAAVLAPSGAAPHLLQTAGESNVSAPPRPATLPFRGNLAFADGPMRLGDYRLSLDVEANGQIWGGDLYLTVACQGEQQRKLCRNGETLLFAFLRASLAVACREVSAVMPIGMNCTISEQARAPRTPECRGYEERYHGRRSIVLENEYLRARILPELGGRLIEFTSKDDGANRMYANPASFAGTTVDGGWVDYGGIEENLGEYPGSIWNAVYTVQFTRREPREVEVTLQCPGIRLDAQRSVSLVKVYMLQSGEIQLHVRQRVRNEGPLEQRLRLWMHPEVRAAGEVSPSDCAYFDAPDAPVSAPFRLEFSASYANRGRWSAIIDQEQRQGIIERYPRETVDALYYLIQNHTCNLEFGTAWRDVLPGQTLELEYAIGLLRGLGGVSACSDDTALNLILPGHGTFVQQQTVDITLEGAALRAANLTIDVALQKDDSTLARIDTVRWRLTPDAPAQAVLHWSTGDIPDGAYTLTAIARDDAGAVQLSARVPLRIAGARIAALRDMAAQFRMRLDVWKAATSGDDPKAWRTRLVRAASTLNDLEDAIAGNRFEEAKTLGAELVELLK